MPVPVSLPAQGTAAPVGGDLGSSRPIRNKADAAAAFEALLLKQLLGAMSKTVGQGGLLGGGLEGQMYGDMFTSAIAEQASGSGLGLSEMIREALGVQDRGRSPAAQPVNRLRGLGHYRAATTGTDDPPSNPYLARVASEWLAGGASERWGKAGALTDGDLSADVRTRAADGGVAAFNVKDAKGYEGDYKCNLFALEMVRRAGYMVPLRAREHGWGYPGADTVAKLASEAKVGDWANVRSQASAAELDAGALSGQPYVLASSASGDAMGHMAVADRIHAIARDASGRIASIEYSGWEAGGSRAAYGRHVWRVYGVPGEGRGGLDEIAVIEPFRAGGREPYRAVDDSLPGASILDGQAASAGAQGQGRIADRKYEER
ncbi:MAG: rod-binding protein [Deltaproteobacteria bacterium]|nr:rod-binding protein [Deltaproteobacteria bacterium]